MLEVWQRVDARPVWATIVITLKASFGLEADKPGAHMRDHYLSDGLTDDTVHDVKMQLGIRVADRYFVNLALGPYESKQVVRNAQGNVISGVIRPWEGELTDAGIDLSIEVNDRLRANVLRRHSRVDADELQEMNNLAWDVTANTATSVVQDGTLNLSALQVVA
jgi:hypothetical protein